jgi:hypothetical protein
MSEEKSGANQPPEASTEEGRSKAELQEQMEAARARMSETVAEIKSVVSHQYEEVRETVETVREGFGEVLDWRTEFERNPVVWGAGAVSVGILIGFGIARAFDEDASARGRKKTTGAGERLVGELTGLADAVLPTISAKVKELFGLDLGAYLHAAHTPRKAAPKKTAPKKTAPKRPSKKRAAGVKGGAHKRIHAKRAASKRGPR